MGGVDCRPILLVQDMDLVKTVMNNSVFWAGCGLDSFVFWTRSSGGIL
jgi:hypothetical protein